LNVPNTMTVEMWIKVNQFSDTFARLYANRSSNTYPFTVGIYGTSSPKIAFADVNNVDSLLSLTTLTTNTWYHIAVVSTGAQATAKIYLNGIDDTGSISSNGFAFSSITNIGSYNGSMYYFNGQIDDLRIYNRALSPEEIQDLYNYEYSSKYAIWQNPVTKNISLKSLESETKEVSTGAPD